MSEHDEAAVGDPWAPQSDSEDTTWPAPPTSQQAREDATDLDHEQWVREQMGDIDDDEDWETPDTEGAAPDETADKGAGAEAVAAVEVDYGGSLGPSMAEPVDLDADMQPLVDLNLGTATDVAASKPRRFDKKVALGFGGALGAAVLIAAIVSMIFYGGSGDQPVTVRQASVADPAVAAPTAPSEAPPAAAVAVDRPLPYTADAVGSCLPGSTSAQSMTGSDPHNAFVCATGGSDGQVIEIDLGKSYVITAISLTPGWVGTDGSGVSQWSQHRVVTTVQWTFNDVDRSLVTQETKNIHGEAVQPIKRVLASKIRMLIRETSRPPANPSDGQPEAAEPGGLPALPHTPPPAGFGDPLFGNSPNSDPVDASFAISSLKIIGHEPL